MKKMYGLFKRDWLFCCKGCKDLKGCMVMNGLNRMLFGICENDQQIFIIIKKMKKVGLVV